MSENNGVNVEIDEDKTTKVPKDAFENAELKFPCDFPLSVMGKNTENYVDTILAILQKHVPGIKKEDLQYAYSGGNKYCSIRVRFIALSREQLDELYKELTANELVKWVL